MSPGMAAVASDRVSERRRAVALARHFREFEGLSIAQIAGRLGRSPATIKAYFYDPTGEKARAVKARYQGVCRGCGAYTQPGNGKGDAYPYCKACHPGAIQRRWTRGRVLAAMRQWRARYGRLPSSVEEDAERLIQHLVTRGRKASTTIGYESYLRVHVAKLFAEKQIAEVTKQDIEEFIAVCLDNDQSIKSTRNYLGLLHSVFDFGLRKGWVVANPCKAVEKPEAADEDQDIRFLDQTELDALLAATTAPRSRRKAGTAERARQVRRLRPREAAVEADRGGARDR